MNVLDGLLQAITEDPGDDTNWLVLADWLEEHDEPRRAGLLRSQRSLLTLRGKARQAAEERVRDLLLAGVRPCVPERTNSIGMRLALIPAGSFRMGSPTREARRMDDEPLHLVRITKPFWMGVFPVTQKEYAAVTGSTPAEFTASTPSCEGVPVWNLPVETVSWQDAMQFCRTLSRRERTESRGLAYRLPTEAEWEYACRAWTSPRWAFYFGPRLTSDLANFNGHHPYPPSRRTAGGRRLGRPSPVGSYPPNAFGLYDVHGNVDEWCLDWCDYEYYPHSPKEDPPGPEGGDTKVIRGGSWVGQGEDCRAAVRIGHGPDERMGSIGFRAVLAAG